MNPCYTAASWFAQKQGRQDSHIINSLFHGLTDTPHRHFIVLLAFFLALLGLGKLLRKL